MISNGTDKPNSSRLWWLVALIVTVNVVTFRDAPFMGAIDYDDPLIFQNESFTKGISAEGLGFALTGLHNNLWHPLTTVSHQLDFQLYGTWVGGHHLTSVLVHIATCLLLFFWLNRFTKKKFLTLAVTLLFAIHPLRVESVIWISERKDVLAAFFYMLAIFLYSEWTTRKLDSTRRYYYLLSIAAAFLAFLSKPSVITLPIALMIIDFWPLRTRISLGRRLWQKTPFILLALIAAVTTWVSLSHNQFVGERFDFTIWQRISYATLAIGSYLQRTIWPQGLAPFHRYPTDLSTAKLIVVALVIITATGWLAFKYRARHSWLPAGWLWFIGLLLPVSGLVTISDNFAPDRYLYIPQIGLLIMVVWLVASLGKKWENTPIVGWILLVVIVVPLSIATTKQTRIWGSPESLWSHTIAVTNQNHLAYHQLGLYYLQTGQPEKGIPHLRDAVAAAPGIPVPQANLALALVRAGEFEEGVRTFGQTNRLLPQRTRFRDEMTQALLEAKENNLAIQLHESFANSENEIESATALGHLHYQLGNYQSALFQYRKVAELAPKDRAGLLTYGSMLLKLGDAKAALPVLEKSNSSHPIAQAHLMLGNYAKALENYEKAIIGNRNRTSLVINEYAQLLLDCPEKSLRNPETALKFARPFNESSNPRFLRTLTRALIENSETTEAAEIAQQAIDSIAELKKAEPLEKPWTHAELDKLKTWFQQIRK